MSHETPRQGLYPDGPCCSNTASGLDEKLGHGPRCRLSHPRREGECIHSHCGGPCLMNEMVPRSKWCTVCVTGHRILCGGGEADQEAKEAYLALEAVDNLLLFASPGELMCNACGDKLTGNPCAPSCPRVVLRMTLGLENQP